MNFNKNSTVLRVPLDFQIQGELRISLLHSSISASTGVKPTLWPLYVDCDAYT